MNNELSSDFQTDSNGTRGNAFVRLGILVNLPPLLESFGCNPSAVIESCGLQLKTFENPKNRISYMSAGRLLAKSVAESGCDHIGLLLGQRYDIAYAGAAGFAASSASTIGEALETICKFLVLSDEGGSMFLKEYGNYVKFGYLIHEKGMLAADQAHDMTLAASFKALEVFCGKDWKPTEVWLSRREPGDSRPYRKYFQAPVRFNTTENALVFHSRYLEQSLPSANPNLHRFLINLVEELKRDSRPDLQRELTIHISLGLLDHEISLINIANRIGLHPRTLNRRLKDMGTSFREIRDNVRKNTACNLLQSTELPIADVALILGYSDSSGFNHAFSRWFGFSPKKWRNLKATALET